ncbi:cobyrinate a,c-diamide synthase [Clostridium sp. Marseille-P3244]|uniref:cobyrinate a,c-diamide synthase n=1 Tax=Clostridium sp. Marseille-P3244 TaxID=1871020 RepID=UPI000931A0DB|nr:cobyrinate a,c-diamide synthase [Clostridium sp. Marseille-P3244]
MRTQDSNTGAAVPGFLIAAPASGSGKTAVSCALMAAFRDRGLKVKACKCGPDYIDPMFHREVLGLDSRNLDLFFSGREELKEGYVRHGTGADLVITEGVMGYYDGLSVDSWEASSYDMARTLGLPVILILPCRGAALSLAAVAAGMAGHRPDSSIKGILLNQVSEARYPGMKSMLERELDRMGYKIPVLGRIPTDEAFHFESRHLGLVTPQEIRSLKEQMARAGQILSGTVELDRILELAGYPGNAGGGKNAIGKCRERTEEKGRDTKDGKIPSIRPDRLRIGVARDAAFCFSYPENLELLRSLGCEIIPFSPLSDDRLPEDLDGLILGGGYPELYARELSERKEMFRDVRKALGAGMPCLAECGGYLYLHETIRDREGRDWPMAGVVKGSAYPGTGLKQFGYVKIRLSGESEAEGTESYLLPGETIRGHEFHYWDSTAEAKSCVAEKPDGRRSWRCIRAEGNLFAGFPHLYLPSLPAFAGRFAGRCGTWRQSVRDGREKTGCPGRY